MRNTTTFTQDWMTLISNGMRLQKRLCSPFAEKNQMIIMWQWETPQLLRKIGFKNQPFFSLSPTKLLVVFISLRNIGFKNHLYFSL